MNAILNNDCMEELKNFPDNIIDSVVTDPPYGLSDLSPEKITTTMMEWASGNHSFIPKGKGFMNKDWDSFVPPPAVWKEVLRVLKPGGHILCFAGSRTVDLMTISLRIAGFEIRDTVMWMYGSGFPKSHNLTGEYEGFGTALKPALEPIVLARKPLDGTVLQNMEKWGVGALNIDKSRISTDNNIDRGGFREKTRGYVGIKSEEMIPAKPASPLGRWPANVILDEDAAVMLDKQTGQLSMRFSESSGSEGFFGGGKAFKSYDDGDNMGASRFFYVAKTSKKEREAGLEDFEDKYIAKGNQAQAELKRGNTDFSRETDTAGQNKILTRKNHHPTVKPVKLMTYLCRLITPPGGTVLDPFTGSGSTGIAAVLEGFTFIGIEQNAEYAEIARKRIDYHLTSK